MRIIDSNVTEKQMNIIKRDLSARFSPADATLTDCIKKESDRWEVTIFTDKRYLTGAVSDFINQCARKARYN